MKAAASAALAAAAGPLLTGAFPEPTRANEGRVSAAPRVEVMVVGRTRVLRAPVKVRARTRAVRAGGRRCAVAPGTPLAALAALRAPSFAVRDFGACSARSPAASELLYVTRVGRDRARGVDGWVFKVGRRAPGIGAANPRARLRAGGRVLWFYCRMEARGCQRTLEVSGPTRAAPGAPVTFVVHGYDDRGRGAPAAGARVRFGGTFATAAADGTVTLTAPAAPGRHRASADAAGMVPSFPLEVRVG